MIDPLIRRLLVQATARLLRAIADADDDCDETAHRKALADLAAWTADLRQAIGNEAAAGVLANADQVAYAS